jgi:hypothetical protein
MTPSSDGSLDGQLAPICNIPVPVRLFAEHLALEMNILQGPDAQHYFSGNAAPPDYLSLAQAAYHAIASQPWIEQKFRDLWYARHNFFVVAARKDDCDDLKWRLAGQWFISTAVDFVLTLGFQTPTNEPPPLEPLTKPAAFHSPDYSTVCWNGISYVFSPQQAACVRALWEAWENGVPEVSVRQLLRAAGSFCPRIRDIFEKGTHRAWGAMIIRGRKRTYRLADNGTDAAR